jgi:hypothetical protein
LQRAIGGLDEKDGKISKRTALWPAGAPQEGNLQAIEGSRKNHSKNLSSKFLPFSRFSLIFFLIRIGSNPEFAHQSAGDPRSLFGGLIRLARREGEVQMSDVYGEFESWGCLWAGDSLHRKRALAFI